MPLARRLIHAAAMITMAVLLSGCIKAHVDLTLNEDDTIDGSMIFAVSKQAIELSGQDADQVIQQMTEGEAPLPEGVEFETDAYEDGDFVGQEYTFTGAPLDTLAEDGGFSITRVGDTFVVEGAADMSGETGVDMDDPMAQQLLESFDVQIQITFPGPVQESNGEVDGNTVTWKPLVGETNEIHAIGSAVDEGGGLLLWIVLAIVAGSIAGLVLLFVFRGKRGDAAEAPAEGWAEGGGATSDAAGMAPAPVPPAPVTTAEPTADVPPAPSEPMSPGPEPMSEPTSPEPPSGHEPAAEPAPSEPEGEAPAEPPSAEAPPEPEGEAPPAPPAP
jgi:hypothetical protein